MCNRLVLQDSRSLFSKLLKKCLLPVITLREIQTNQAHYQIDQVESNLLASLIVFIQPIISLLGDIILILSEIWVIHNTAGNGHYLKKGFNLMKAQLWSSYLPAYNYEPAVFQRILILLSGCFSANSKQLTSFHFICKRGNRKQRMMETKSSQRDHSLVPLFGWVWWSQFCEKNGSHIYMCPNMCHRHHLDTIKPEEISLPYTYMTCDFVLWLVGPAGLSVTLEVKLKIPKILR